eukprot:1043098-Rhodomonas_salina.2
MTPSGCPDRIQRHPSQGYHRELNEKGGDDVMYGRKSGSPRCGGCQLGLGSARSRPSRYQRGRFLSKFRKTCSQDSAIDRVKTSLMNNLSAAFCSSWMGGHSGLMIGTGTIHKQDRSCWQEVDLGPDTHVSRFPSLRTNFTSE